jgi:DNA polymerase-3 subunit alpha
VFDLFCRGETTSLFQFESGGMRRVLREAQPRRIEDLIALNALYRPGPMDYIPQFIEGKFDAKKIKYPDSSLKDILKETYGVMVYQEQVMQVAQRIAGYSLGQADILRRAMGKKKAEVMVAEKQKFIDGAVANGFDANRAGEIFEIMLPFAGYGFNKSHAAAYSVVAYQTAYLKAHFPLEFYAASLTNEMNKTDGQMVVYVEEARGKGVAVRLPDVNKSQAVFASEDGAIRFALAGIKGVGEASAEAIIAERQKGGAFKSLYDFCERVDLRAVNKGTFEALIKAGAFDALGGDGSPADGRRAQYLAGMELAIAWGQNEQDRKANGESSLFGGDDQIQPPPLPNAAAWDLKTQLNFERDALGFYASGHPLSEHAALLKSFATATTGDLAEMANKTVVTLGGMVAAVSRKTDKKGRPFAIVTLEDLLGTVEVMAFVRTYQKYESLLTPENLLLVRGKLDTAREKPSILADEFVTFDGAIAAWAQGVTVNLADTAITAETVEKLQKIVARFRGQTPLYLQVKVETNAESRPSGDDNSSATASDAEAINSAFRIPHSALDTASPRLAMIRAGKDFYVAPNHDFNAELKELIGKNHVFYQSRAAS